MEIFFIYDTSYCKSDEDDPKNAVVFFYHPLEICDMQRYTLCCQLVGIAQFLKRTFSNLSSLVLDHAKFVFFHSKNFLFVLGGNFDVACEVLKKQLIYLCETFNFYYGDITTILENCLDRQTFLDKMKTVWTDLLYAAKSSNSLSKIPFSTIPFSVIHQNSNLSRRASLLLQMCQLNSAVIAGAVFYNNFMLSTQLTPELTSYLCILSHSPSLSICNLSSIKNLPPGVELAYVYVSKDQLEKVMTLNHKNLGNRIRVRSKDEILKQSPVSNCDNVNSGSEGDIDSEYPVFSCKIQKNPDSNIHVESSETSDYSSNSSQNKYQNSSSLKDKNSEMYSISEIFQSHSKGIFNDHQKIDVESQTVLRKILFKSKKRHISKALNKLKEGKPLLPDSSNLICDQHASHLAIHFMSTLRTKYTSKKSHCELEFSCHLCTNAVKQIPFCHYDMAKHWHSEVSLSQLPCRKEAEFNYLIKTLCFSNLVHNDNSPHTSKKREKKLQFLNCRRSSSGDSRKFQRKAEKLSSREMKNQVGNLLCNQTCSQFPTFKKSPVSVETRSVFGDPSIQTRRKQSWTEKEVMQKVVLLSQQYKGSRLVSLLSSACDQKVVDYVWNCGFSTLKDLELSMKKNAIDDEKTENTFCIFLYDSIRKTLTYTPSDFNLLMKKYDHESLLLGIHQDFLSNSSLSSIFLLTKNKTIFAQQYRNHNIMYLQKENPSRNLEFLGNLIKKAAYRIAKSFTFNILRN